MQGPGRISKGIQGGVVVSVSARMSHRYDSPAAGSVSHDATPQAPLRRQISHDIHHELSTIMLLASLLAAGADVGPDSRERARHLLGETRWLHQLHLAYEDSVAGAGEVVRSSAEPVRIDLLAAEVVTAMQLSTLTRIGLAAQEAWAHVDRLEFWRGLRNLVGNAVRAAGADGRVEVRVTTGAGWA